VFVGNNEFEEHQVLPIPAGGFVQLSYTYSTDFTLAGVQALAQAAQDRMQPVVAITSQANGATVSTPTVPVTGTATAGSGIPSLFVAGQPVSVKTDGSWSASVPLSLGSNTIVATGTDATGATSQTQVTIIYQPPPAPPIPPVPTPAVTCKVPRLKGLKLRTAELRLRHAHCRVGKISHVHSRHIAKSRVVSTSPRARRERPAGSKVELFVSEGP
jgi:hypothetical protein